MKRMIQMVYTFIFVMCTRCGNRTGMLKEDIYGILHAIPINKKSVLVCLQRKH